MTDIDRVTDEEIQRNSETFSPKQFRQFARRFSSFKVAENNGFYSRSKWKRQGRVVEKDELPSIVVKDQGIVAEPCSYHVVLEHVVHDRYRCALDYYEVFSKEQTAEKPISAKPLKRKTNHSNPKAREDKAETPIYFHIPENLDPSCNHTNYVFSLLHWSWLHWKADERGFIPLKSAYMHRMIPEWASFRDHLVSDGLIECDYTYVEGEKCMGHRPCEKHWTKARRVACTDGRLASLIRKGKVHHQPVHAWLEENFASLEFDLDLAEKLVPTIPLPKTESREQADFRNFEVARRCAEGAFHSSVCPYGRFHSNLTNMSKELRPCLTIKGEQLVGVDLANSQPLIAAIMSIRFFAGKKQKNRLLQKTFSDSKINYATRELSHLEKELSRTFPHLSTSSNSTNISSSRSLVTTSQSSFPTSSLYTISVDSQVIDSVRGLRQFQSGTRPDLQAYLEACEQGGLYEAMMNAGDEKQAFKKQFFTEIFFGRCQQKSKLRSRFAKCYPSIHEMLITIKKKDYRLSAYLMQHYESTIFIGKICERLRREHPDDPVYTIHDSILCLPSHLNVVKEVIAEEFNRLGVHPTLREEDYRSY